MAVVSMKQLLEAGVHFGHQTRRWNPKMKPYIYTERNGIHIIDLQKTVGSLDRAYNFVRDITAAGGKVLFVGTKKQAQEAVAEEAMRAGQYYVNQRWLGGLLTNFNTIQQRLRRLEELEQMRDTGVFERLPKKEQIKLNLKIRKLTRLLGGVRHMKRLPNVLFIIDTKNEQIAIHEAARLEIPVVALLDTNSDPDEVQYPIPANDDAIRAVRLLSSKIADAAHEGASEYESTMAKEEAEADLEEDYAAGYTADPEGYDASIDGDDADLEKILVEAESNGLDGPSSEELVELEVTPTEDLEPANVAAPLESETAVEIAEPEVLPEVAAIGLPDDPGGVEEPVAIEVPAAKKPARKRVT